MISRILRHIGWRSLLKHRWQSLLMILGIALGVAVMVAIDLASASASRAFDISTEALTGKTTHQISGGPQGVAEGVYTQLKREGWQYPIAPVLSDIVTSPQLGQAPLQLIGIDPFVDGQFRSYLNSDSRLPLQQLVPFLTRPGAVLLLSDTAAHYSLNPGDSFTLESGGKSYSVWLAGTLKAKNTLAIQSLENVVLSDISTAQEITGRIGWIDHIDCILPDNITAVHLQAKLPSGVSLQTTDARSGVVSQMTAAFRLNLSALSLLALIVGLFLIYNTMTFSVVQRRELFGMLRCLGVTRAEVFRMVLTEALAVAAIGSVTGIILGVWMGQFTIQMVSQTINDLYFTTTVQAKSIDIQSLLKGGALGILATVAAAVLPAWEAAGVQPRAALARSGLESKIKQSVLWITLGGVGMAAIGGLLLLIPVNSVPLGFAGTTFIVVGFAMFTALILIGVSRLLIPIGGKVFGFLGRMAPRSLSNALSRTSVAVAALMVAVAVTVGMTMMVDSFRNTVTVWLSQSLQSDIYVTVPGATETTPTIAIDPLVLETIQKWPGIKKVDLLRATFVQSSEGPIQVMASSNEKLGFERLFRSLAGSKEDVLRELKNGSVIVSEPLANRLHLKVGDPLNLVTSMGTQAFQVFGIYQDYSSSEGELLMSRDIFIRYWADESVTAIGVRLPEGSDANQLAKDLQSALAKIQTLRIRPNLVLRNDVLRVFDQTFMITSALRVLTTVVAFIGILSSLMLLQLEKQREIGILRSLGLTGGQLWRLVMLETGLMGLVSGLLALPTGTVLALILIEVINKRSFGWSLQLLIKPEAFATALGISMGAALLAGVYPAWRMSRMAAAEVIRSE